MPVQDDLYEAVLEAPDRLGPRRRYAEYLEQHGDELGHYIRLRLQQLQASLDNQSYERMLELEVKLGPRLRAPLQPWVRSAPLDRGLVAHVKMDAKSFLDHGRDVFAGAPIQHLDLFDAKPVFAAIVQDPTLAQVQTLAIETSDLEDREATLLASSPFVRRLVYLNLAGNKIGQPGLEAITASPNLAALRVLHVEFNPVEDPVSKWSNDGVSGLTYYEGAGPMQALLKKKYGEKAWMEPPQNIDRYRMCDAGE
jgi:uncharacterized protein (TIGR02996 family)